MRSFPLPTGVRIIDEAPFEDRLDDIAHRMMHDAIAERSSFDDALFGIVHHKFPIATVPIGLTRQLRTQRKQIFFERITELQDGGTIALAPPSVLI